MTLPESHYRKIPISELRDPDTGPFDVYVNYWWVVTVDKLNPDWNAQAAKKAQEYLDSSSFSRQGLVEQLVFEGFTPEQAEYGASQVY